MVKYLASFSLVVFIFCARAENQLPDTATAIENADQVTIPATPVPAAGAVSAEQAEQMDHGTTDGTENTPGESGISVDVLVDKDVVLVLDNSGSMKKNDPDFLVKQAVTEFIRSQDDATRVAIVIFDQEIQLALPLTEASLDQRETILSSIDLIDYRGQLTDSPAGIERALYELKINGRDNARKFVIFMTDGIVDTGDANRDLEKAQWLQGSLAPDAADSDISIFAVAFTDAADFQLIQSLAQTTDGEYYRALAAEDLQRVFEHINTIINTPPTPIEPVTPEAESKPASIEPQASTPVPVIIEVPDRALVQEERIRSIIIIAVAIILVVILLAILILLLKRSREMKGPAEAVKEAYLNDLQGKTDHQTHKIGGKPVMLGRVAGSDTDRLDYIVVNETTIGRQHALIEYKDYAFWLVDQGSINGTFINGEMITAEVRLKHGDHIRLHKCEFEFTMPGMEESDATVMAQTVFSKPDQSADIAQPGEMHGGKNDTASFDIGAADDSEIEFDITEADSDEAAVSEDHPGSASDTEDETVWLDNTGAKKNGDKQNNPDRDGA